MAHKGQAKSVAWRLFDVTEDDISRVCGKTLSRGGKNEKSFTTTNMMKHLKTSHKERLKEEEDLIKYDLEQRKRSEKRMSDFIDVSTKKKSKTCQNQTAGSSQITIEQTLELKKIWDINSNQAKAIHHAIGEMIAVDSQPFSIVEDLGFQRLMKLTKPSYELPSRKYFTNTIIPEMYDKVMMKINTKITNASHISFTTDIWTNNADTSFIR